MLISTYSDHWESGPTMYPVHTSSGQRTSRRARDCRTYLRCRYMVLVCMYVPESNRSVVVVDVAATRSAVPSQLLYEYVRPMTVCDPQHRFVRMVVSFLAPNLCLSLVD